MALIDHVIRILLDSSDVSKGASEVTSSLSKITSDANKFSGSLDTAFQGSTNQIQGFSQSVSSVNLTPLGNGLSKISQESITASSGLNDISVSLGEVAAVGSIAQTSATAVNSALALTAAQGAASSRALAITSASAVAVSSSLNATAISASRASSSVALLENRTNRASVSFSSRFRRALTGARNQLGRLEQRTRGFSNRLNAALDAPIGNILTLQNAIRGVVFSALITQVVQTADALTLATSRVNLFTDSIQETNVVLDQLTQISNNTFTAITSNTDLFARFSNVTKDLGFNTGQVLAITEGLQQSFRLSGSTAAEAASSALQLSQGLGSGALRGDEFRSISESNVVLLKLLSEELGVATGELKDLGAAGAITSDVVANALISNLDSLRDRTSQLAITTSQAFQVITNEYTLLVNSLNSSTGTTNFITDIFLQGSDAIRFLREEFGTFAIVTGIEFQRSANSLQTSFDSAFLTVRLTFEQFIQSIRERIASVLGDVSIGLDIAGLDEASVATNEFAQSLRNVRSISQEVNDQLKDRIATGKEVDAQLMELAQSEVNLSEARIRSAREDLRISAERVSALQNSKAAIKAENDEFAAQQRVLQILNPEQARMNASVRQLTADLKANLITQFQYELAIAEVTVTLTSANEKFAAQQRLLQILNPEAARYNATVAQLQQDLEAGLITQEQFNAGLDETISQFEDAEDSAINFGEIVQTSVENASGRASDAIIDFVTTGKASFSDLAASILRDIARMIIQQQILNAVRASGGFGFSDGGAFSQGQQVAFADGGVVSGPTVFPMANGNTGLMGEAGPEAIMPLQRDSRGRLGVTSSSQSSGPRTIVNIQNNTGSDPEVERTTDPLGNERIDIIINRTVEQGLGSGRFDTLLGARFGLNRVGT